ncbi:ABC transporter permease [Flavitalea sp.]|nr:ABC transporter permease [Flavitalea sp.]
MAKGSKERSTWRRLRKNRGALAGIVIIIIALLIALLGYMIAPDSSSNANRMIVEIGGQKPGFSMLFLKTPTQREQAQPSFLEKLFFGGKDLYDYTPITSYNENRDSLVITQYIDEGLEERKAFLLEKPGINNPNSGSKIKKAGSQKINSDSNINLLNNGERIISEYHIEKIRFHLGTDKYGRDILSRLLIGVRVSLGVGLITVIISLSIGVMLGAVAGYYRGWVDELVMWFINVIWSIPTLLLVFAITLVLGKGFWQIFIAIGLTMWVSVARIIRGQVLAVREMEYVEAARALGFTNARIIVRHVLPNVMGPVIVVAASNFASAIVIEAGLSFLGVGVQPPQPSWGLMIKENYNFIITHNPMLALAPGIAIMILVLAFNLLGNGLRDALQVKD